MFAAYGIMAALLARHHTGRGQFVDTSLLRVGLAFVESNIMDNLNNGTPVSQDAYARGRIYSFIDSDGLPLIIHLGGHPESWDGMVKAAGREDLLKDTRFRDRKARSENHEEIVQILKEEFRKKPRSHWREALDSYGVPNAPIYRVDEVFEDPQIKHMGLPVEVSHPQMGPIRMVGSAIGLSDTPPQISMPAPLLGEHTAEILHRLDYSDEAIQELQGQGVV
jgi:formyl-CoA transferase